MEFGRRAMNKDVNVVVAGSADPDLVNEIMHLIGRYCEAIQVVPCPEELRDIMLAVAALSHLEAAKLDCTPIELAGEDFAEAARENFRDVTGVHPMPLLCTRPAVQVQH